MFRLISISTISDDVRWFVSNVVEYIPYLFMFGCTILCRNFKVHIHVHLFWIMSLPKVKTFVT